MQKEFIYLYKEKEYKVLVTYKRSRSISMRIKDGILKVNAPYLTSYKSISNVIDKYAYKLFEENSHNTGRGDDYIYILGIKIEITYPGYILFNDNQSIVYKDEADLDKKLKKWFLSLLVERTRYYENIMGLYENKIHLKNMVSRYGSNVYSKHSMQFCFFTVVSILFPIPQF